MREGRGWVSFHIHIDKDIGTLLTDVVVVEEDATPCHLMALDGIGDMNGGGANEPHIAVHSSMVGEVELCLFLSWRVVLVITVVSLHGNQTGITGLEVQVVDVVAREINGDGEVAAEVFLYKDAVDIYLLLSHDGLEVHGDLLPLHILGNHEPFPIPGDALVVTASAGLARFQARGMWSTYHLPLGVIVGDGLCSLRIS